MLHVFGCSTFVLQSFTLQNVLGAQKQLLKKPLQTEGERTDGSTNKQTPVQTEGARRCRDTEGASVRNKNISSIA